jgi:uncharacterized protein YjaZ
LNIYQLLTFALSGASILCDCIARSYGSFVRQLLIDFEDPVEVNTQLESMGYNIGVRLVDDFFAKSKISALTILYAAAYQILP